MTSSRTVPLPEGTVVLTAAALEFIYVPGPEGTVAPALQFRDDALGEFVVALSFSGVQTLHNGIRQLSALTAEQVAEIRDQAHGVNEG